MLWDVLHQSCFCPQFVLLTSPRPLYSKQPNPLGHMCELFKISGVSVQRLNSMSSRAHPSQSTPLSLAARVFFFRGEVLTRWLSTLHGVYLMHVKLMCPCHAKLWECKLLYWGLPPSTSILSAFSSTIIYINTKGRSERMLHNHTFIQCLRYQSCHLIVNSLYMEFSWSSLHLVWHFPTGLKISPDRLSSCIYIT